jgi:cell division septum initiation protein DivIVA
MPDDSTASTEHALIQEITAPLGSLPDDSLPDVADVDFPVALRGYDRLAVDAYVKRTSQLVAELQSTRSPESAVRRALGRVGEEVSGILQRAHETAEQITAQSRIDAENRLDAARQEAAQITVDSHRRLKELDAETDRIWAERHRIVEDARELASQLLALAESAISRFPAADDLEEGADPAEEVPEETDGFGPQPVGADGFGLEQDEVGGVFASGPVDEEALAQDAAAELASEDEHGSAQADEATNGSATGHDWTVPDDGEVTAIMPPIDFEHERPDPPAFEERHDAPPGEHQ